MLRLLKDAFEAPPGAVSYRISEPVVAPYSYREFEHFIVSVEAKGLPSFSIECNPFLRFSKHVLEGYADAEFDKLFKLHTARRKLPSIWGRSEKRALFLAMSASPERSGYLDCKKDRLVLHWKRPANTPEETDVSPFLADAKAVLEHLARTLADMPRSDAFSREGRRS